MLSRLMAFRLCYHDDYPAWRDRRRAEGRLSGWLAFVWLYGNPLTDGQGFLERTHPDNRPAGWRFTLVAVVFFVLFMLFFWLLIAVAQSFGTK